MFHINLDIMPFNNSAHKRMTSLSMIKIKVHNATCILVVSLVSCCVMPNEIMQRTEDIPVHRDHHKKDKVTSGKMWPPTATQASPKLKK
jgi:hypothetical protein